MYKTSENITWRKKAELLIILNTTTGHYYTVNPTGAILWGAVVENGKPIEEAVAEIKAKFADAPDEAAVLGECRELLAEWEKEGLIAAA